jgi:hypothetical protein
MSAAATGGTTRIADLPRRCTVRSSLEDARSPWVGVASRRSLEGESCRSGTADYQRVYQLIRQPAPIADRLLQVEFLDGAVEAFVFTFG